MDISFTGKRILVTGAGRGIGKDVCIRLHKCGAQVVAVSKTRSNLDALKKEIPNSEIVCVDLADWDATRKAILKVVDKPIHGLVNNAGLLCIEPFLTTTPESFDLTFNVNVKALLNISQIVAKEMVNRKTGGSIVNVSSQASLGGCIDHATYSASKGAVDAMNRVMAVELGPHNIRVNCVNPTVVLTDMGKIAWSDPEAAKSFIDKIPLRRFAEVHEVTDVILYLLSDKSSMINGITLPIDGGFLAT